MYNFFYIGKQRKSTHDAVAEGPIMSTFCIYGPASKPAKKVAQMIFYLVNWIREEDL